VGTGMGFSIKRVTWPASRARAREPRRVRSLASLPSLIFSIMRSMKLEHFFLPSRAARSREAAATRAWKILFRRHPSRIDIFA